MVEKKEYIISDNELINYLNDIRGISHLGLGIITEVVQRFLKSKQPVSPSSTDKITHIDIVGKIISKFNEVGVMDNNLKNFAEELATDILSGSTDKVICPELDCQENEDGVCMSEDGVDIIYNCHNPRGENQ